mmetsp:Transcript_48417/g.75600  ORF Transcript_48417/g.75600 Transcript_48417/m.75600 type:complete len:143 (+) Transcript_48417:306-734(+)
MGFASFEMVGSWQLWDDTIPRRTKQKEYRPSNKDLNEDHEAKQIKTFRRTLTENEAVSAKGMPAFSQTRCTEQKSRNLRTVSHKKEAQNGTRHSTRERYLGIDRTLMIRGAPDVEAHWDRAHQQGSLSSVGKTLTRESVSSG